MGWLVLALISGPVGATEVWRARLLLAGGEPAAGHVVSVVGSPLSAVCDENGVFSLTSPPAPPFQIVAKGPDNILYSALTIDTLATAEPADATPVELRLEPLAVDSVTVVSGIAPGLDLLPGSAATVINAEAVEQRPPQRLVDVLDSVAGASKLGEGADSVPALRGLARGRTLILLDGARVSAERRASPSATFVDPNGLAAVEVLRGPGSVVYGSDAFGGVIQAVTRDPDLERASARVGVEAAAGGEDRISAYASGSLPIGNASLLLEVHGAEGRGQEAGGGDAIFNSSFDSLGGALRLLAPIGPGRLRASLQVERVDDLGKAAIDSRQIRAVYPREDADRLVLSWIADPAGGAALDDAPAPGAWLTGRCTAGRAYAFARAAGFDRKDDPGPTETERPDYVLLDLGGGYHVTDEVELRLAVRNAFDREYTASPDVTADRSPGRAVTLGISGKF